jgi:hypothetical protein
MEERLQKAIDATWSDYSDLDYWVKEMSRKDGVPTKWVLKMAMKHLRDDLYKTHALLCELREREEGV